MCIEKALDENGCELPEVIVSSHWMSLYDKAIGASGWCWDYRTAGIVYTSRNGSFVAACQHPAVVSADHLSDHL